MSSTAEWSHRTLLAAGHEVQRGLARDFVGLHLLAHHLPHLVEDMRLVVSELATNAVVHAQTEFLVTLSSRSGMVLLEVRDASTSAVLPRTPTPMDTSGRGMLVVEVLSQQWGPTSTRSVSRPYGRCSHVTRRNSHVTRRERRTPAHRHYVGDRCQEASVVSSPDDELIEDLGSSDLAFVAGVLALGEQGGAELDAGLEERARLADVLELAVHDRAWRSSRYQS